MKLERKDEIIRLITENRVAKANELAEYFHVSMETIRRDLSQLEKEGFLRRTHGGAVLNTSGGMEPTFYHREVSNYEEKLLIARKAAELVEDGDTIIIDIGTTTIEFARFLKGKKVTVFTNSLKIAVELMDDAQISVILFGGFVRADEGTTSGHWAEEMSDQFWVDKLFLGVGSMEPDIGIMDFHIEETNLRRHWLAHSRKVIALADHSKFGWKALNAVCRTEELDILVTDEETDKRTIKEIRERGVQVLLA